VQVEGIRLGGLDETAARKALTQSAAARQKHVILQGAGRWAISAQAPGVELDTDKSARLAMQVGTSGTALRRWSELLLSGGLPGGLPACYRADVPRMRAALRRLARRVDKEPQPARWERGEDGVRLRLHLPGRALDVGATLARLQQEMAQGLRRPVPMALLRVEPRLTAQVLQDATEQLGQARVALGSGVRWANVRAGLRALDATVICAGSWLSGCEGVLPLSPTRGFRFATDEQSEVALGGGVEICLKLLATAAGHAGLLATWHELDPELAALLPVRSDLLVANTMMKDLVVTAGVERGYGWIRISGKRAPTAGPQSRARWQPELGGVTVAFVGDVLPTSPCEGTGPAGALTKAADLAFANLECPISSRGNPLKAKQAPGEWAFRASSPIAREQLRNWGLDVVSVANNHALDYGPQAMEDTLAVLSQEGVRCAGVGTDAASAWRPAIIDLDKLTVGFICCVASETLPNAGQFEAGPERPGMAVLPTEGVRLAQSCRELGEQVRALRWQVDLLIVSVHWGKEATGTPTAIQRELGRSAAAAGADIVVGHHPHRLQALELANSGKCLVAYSLGNFVFPARRPKQRHSGVLLVRWGPKGLIAAGFMPGLIEGGQPRSVLDPDLKRQISREVLGNTA